MSVKKEKVLSSKFIEGKDSKNIAYICGLLWADGSIGGLISNRSRITLGIHNNDYNYVEDVFKSIGDWAIYKRSSGVNNQMTYITTHNTKLVKHLNSLGYIKGRTNMYLASNYFSSELRHHWWRGYFDGDGCFSKGKQYQRCASFSACYDYDWSALVDLLNLYKIYHKISKIDTPSNGKWSNLVFYKKSSIKIFGEYLYQDSQNLRFERKYNKWLECIK